MTYELVITREFIQMAMTEKERKEACNRAASIYNHDNDSEYDVMDNANDEYNNGRDDMFRILEVW